MGRLLDIISLSTPNYFPLLTKNIWFIYMFLIQSLIYFYQRYSVNSNISHTSKLPEDPNKIVYLYQSGVSDTITFSIAIKIIPYLAEMIQNSKSFMWGR